MLQADVIKCIPSPIWAYVGQQSSRGSCAGPGSPEKLADFAGV